MRNGNPGASNPTTSPSSTAAGIAIGYDPDRKARRTFALQRIRKAKSTKVPFLRPADFSLDDHLGGSFGVWHNPADRGKRRRIKLRFTGWAARLVSERRWHPSQQLEWRGTKQEELVMTLELSSFEEIRRWILTGAPRSRCFRHRSCARTSGRSRSACLALPEEVTLDPPHGSTVWERKA